MQIGVKLPATRLTCQVCLQTADEWTRYRPAVIDTGAPVCLFPRTLWSSTEYEPLGRVQIAGISRRPECRMPALLAFVKCMISDGISSWGPLKMKAYLAESDSAPTLIGILGFIEKGILHVDLTGNRVFLDSR